MDLIQVAECMPKCGQKDTVDKQTAKDCALVAELFGLCCKRCEDLLVSIVGNRPVGGCLCVRESIFDRSALLTETNVENALSCFRLVVLRAIAKRPSLCRKSRFNGHDTLFYIKGLEILWQTTFSSLKRTLTAPKCLIVAEHAIVKALTEIEYLYCNGERRYSCEEVREAFQIFLKTLPDVAVALAQHDYKNPIGGIGSRTVCRGLGVPEAIKESESSTERGCGSQSGDGFLQIGRRSRAGEVCSITDEKYEMIIKVVKNVAMTWESTPNSYRYMGEEDLRNVLLASLNGLSPGRANGESFRKDGKTDICIEYEDRTAFVAECKKWNGVRDVPRALAQLDSYLTWKDCKTALIYFVDRKDFLAIADKMLAVLQEQKVLQGVRALDRNEFVCRMLSTRTPGHVINVRVLLFNLHSDEDKKGASK